MLVRPFALVAVMLGKRCNLNCAICSQKPYLEQVEEGLDVDGKLLDFLRANSVKSGISYGNLGCQVRFWGGEPLLYFAQIKEIVEKLKGYAFRYSITTNALLLTEEMVDFFNEHEVRVTLSNDGPRTAEVKGVNNLEEERVVRLFGRLSKKAVSVTLHALSQDLFKVWDYVQGKVGSVPIYSGNVIRVDEHVADMFVDFDVAAWEQTYERIIAKANACIKSEEPHPARDYMQGLFLRLLKRYAGEDPRVLFCGQMHDRTAVDLSGNVYPCHNCGESFGQVTEGYGQLLERYWQLGLNPDKWPECRSCPVQGLCLGYCPYVQPSASKGKVCEVLRVIFGERLFVYQPVQSYLASGLGLLPKGREGQC